MLFIIYQRTKIIPLYLRSYILTLHLIAIFSRWYPWARNGTVRKCGHFFLSSEAHTCSSRIFTSSDNCNFNNSWAVSAATNGPSARAAQHICHPQFGLFQLSPNILWKTSVPQSSLQWRLLCRLSSKRKRHVRDDDDARDARLEKRQLSRAADRTWVEAAASAPAAPPQRERSAGWSATLRSSLQGFRCSGSTAGCAASRPCSRCSLPG